MLQTLPIMETGRAPLSSVPPLDGDGPVWLQMRRAIATAILNEDWPAGTRIPGELELTEHYKTSRMTVNKALQSLAHEGLLQRRQRYGTIVTGRARERPVFEIWDPADAINRAGGEYGYRLLQCEMLPPQSELRAQLPLPRPTPMLHMICLHSSGAKPFQLEERLVNVKAAPKITCYPLETVSPGPWLLAHVPWTEARHRVYADAASEYVAEHLGLAAGSPCLVVERRTWKEERPVTLARFWSPGGEHSLEGAFRPTW